MITLETMNDPLHFSKLEPADIVAAAPYQVLNEAHKINRRPKRSSKRQEAH